MNCVNWFGAMEFCDWIGARLPTEDEWYEEASNNGRRNYPWGDTPESNCTHAVIENVRLAEAAVCILPARYVPSRWKQCQWRLRSVWEWTSTVRRLKRSHSRWFWGADIGNQYLLDAAAWSSNANDSFYDEVGFHCVSDTPPMTGPASDGGLWLILSTPLPAHQILRLTYGTVSPEKVDVSLFIETTGECAELLVVGG